MSILSLRTPARPPLPRSPRPAAEPLATRRVSSQLLLDGARELVIQHRGGEYHLRLTRNDKLILTR
ncbi:MAG: hemin uptake protein HemP [Pseudomonadota bacterium]|nr:hemin uptake protein HemP [Xanthomonadaceae bacterium]MDE3211311.1 hemin uptake protein HemP [Pseudomonadota bacterium]